MVMGGFTKSGREEQLKGIEDIADVRSAGMGVTPPGGHPDELMPGDGEIPDFVLKELEKLSEEERNARLAAHAHAHDHEAAELVSPDEAVAFVQEQVRQGADYIKIMIEEGSVLASPGLPVLSKEIMRTAVEEAHLQNKITLAHVLTVEHLAALECFYRVIALEPDNFDGHWHRAQTLLELEHFVEALEACDILIEMEPKNQDLLVLIGRCHFGLRQIPEARKVFRESIELNNKDNYHLGSVKWNS